jgi:hypothetical protein
MNAIDGFLSQRNTTLMANLQRIKPKKKKIQVPKTVSHIEHAEQSEIDLSASILIVRRVEKLLRLEETLLKR